MFLHLWRNVFTTSLFHLHGDKHIPGHLNGKVRGVSESGPHARVLASNSRQSQSLGGQLAKRTEKTLCRQPMTAEGAVKGDCFFCLFSSPFLPPSVPLLLSNSVCQLGVHSKTLLEYLMRITRLGAVGFLLLCVSACISACMCGYVCVCVCPLFVEQKCPSVSPDRHLAVSHRP